MTAIDWSAWGPAGLFGIFTLVVLKLFLDYLAKHDSTILANQERIIDTLNKTDTTLASLTKLIIDHDSRVQGTMEIMAKFIGFDEHPAGKREQR